MTYAPDADRGRRVVFVRGLDLMARLGIHPHEKAGPQRTRMDIELLVETLAERVAAAALADRRVERVRVAVEKPDAFADVAAVGVVVERRRP